MSLKDLSSSELAKIDAICLSFESDFRRGKSPDIAEFVASYGGDHREDLRCELELVQEELASSVIEPSGMETDPGSPPDSYFETIALPRPGGTIGPYVVGSQLGRGGMGVVFSAVDTRLDRQVAIKVLAIEIAKRKDLTERFEREARAVAAISHPNIVELFDIGVANGLPYAVMEYLDGELLDERLRRGAIEPQEVRRLGAQIADALSTAHEANVIHRDLKPHNVMLVKNRRDNNSVETEYRSADQESGTIAKLFDFGLSRAPDFAFGDAAEQTGDGVILGTPGYMAPEQVRGERVTTAADIFSLGCVLYEAFYGQLAFDGDTKSARFAAALNSDPPTDPIRRRADLPLSELIDRCLAKDADARPESAASIAKELRSGITSPATTTPKRSSGKDARPWSRRGWLMLAAGGVGAAALAALYFRNDPQQLNDVKSLAVLSFMEDTSQDSTRVASVEGDRPMPAPVGDTKLKRGEQLASMLVHELTRSSQLKVPPFRPLVAETPSQFRELGRTLEVDAFLTGKMRSIQEGSTKFLELDLQIVSAINGKQLWGKTILTEAGTSLLEQGKVATEIASAIGQRLTSTADEEAPPSVDSFNCLVDGKTRADPDSQVGLAMALMCFQKAHEADLRFADPVAGIALTSITLAAQSTSEEAVKLIQQARDSADEALRRDPVSIDARLALAMLDWQTVGRYRQADRSFQELVMAEPNNWQVRYQYGLLLLTLGRPGEAARSLREASQLNPLSVLAKVERARSEWYRGNVERAIQDAKRLRDKYEHNDFARGLLIDIYEHQGRYELAAAEDPSLGFKPEGSAEEYLSKRKQRLVELPYGAFGEACNAAILQARTLEGFDDYMLAELTDPMPAMLPLLLAVHPSFAAARLLPRAEEILPDPNQSAR
ncbi:MAG: protein kinase domain-containing protein [Rubripirellula sp.]